jgi:hypothetical protein
MKSRFAVLGVGVALSWLVAAPVSAQELVEQRIQERDRENILQNIRDQIQPMLKGAAMISAGATSAGRMRFTGEDSDFDSRNPFAPRETTDPFAAMAYTKAIKAPPMPAIPVWLYGVNGIISYDRTSAGVAGTLATTTTGTVAVDVTKIGIFSTSDALTFLATGADSWSHIPASFFNSSTPSGSGTLAYTNANFSADLTATASWTSNSATAAGVVAPANSSMMSYTGNAQYKVEIVNSWFVEPTAGAVYYDFFTPNFGTSAGTATEIHAGGRIGGEVTVSGIKLQPQFSAAAFEIVSVSGAGGVAAAGAANVAAQLNRLGGRGAAKLNILWTNNFSTYAEAHISNVIGTNTAGVSGGLRYSF